MTDGQGRKVDFKNTVIIMTSNIGAKAGETQRPTIGFSSAASQEVQKMDAVKAELKKALPPEFLNRIDEIIIFKSLEKDNLYKIADSELEKVAMKLKERDIELTWGKSVKDLVLKHGFDKEMGARPMERFISKNIKKPLVDKLLFGNLKAGGQIKLDIESDNLKFTEIKEKVKV